MAELNLSKAEAQAFNLLRASPTELQKIARPDGTVSIDDLHNYFATLSRNMQYAQDRRRHEYIDVEKVL